MKLVHCGASQKEVNTCSENFAPAGSAVVALSRALKKNERKVLSASSLNSQSGFWIRVCIVWNAKALRLVLS